MKCYLKELKWFFQRVKTKLFMIIFNTNGKLSSLNGRKRYKFKDTKHFTSDTY